MSQQHSADITGSAADRGIRVEVYPGGALSSLSLDRRAMTLGSRELSAAILATVEQATAVANQRTKAALREALDGLGQNELTLLGLNQDGALTERAESTTPDSWRAT
jgi:type VI protein secretion system component VasA